LQVAQPGAILPEHEHEVAQFRIVLSGELLYKGIELKGGDWIYTPKGAKYTLSVGTNPAKPCVILYAY
jgi:quercetin dioxygenase-like cupin family protein